MAAQDVDQAQAAYDAAVAQQQGAENAVIQARAGLASAVALQLQVPIQEQNVAGARAETAQAVAGIATAKTGYDVIREREAAVTAAETAVAQAQAQLAAARQTLADTRIVAPRDAVVGDQVSVQPGQIVQSSQALLTLVFSNRKWVTANFKETQLRNVRLGQPAAIRVDLLGQVFPGHVTDLGAATGAALALLPAENATGNFTKVVQRVPVRIDFDDASMRSLAVGLSVEVTIDTTRGASAANTADAHLAH